MENFQPPLYTSTPAKYQDDSIFKPVSIKIEPATPEKKPEVVYDKKSENIFRPWESQPLEKNTATPTTPMSPGIVRGESVFHSRPSQPSTTMDFTRGSANYAICPLVSEKHSQLCAKLLEGHRSDTYMDNLLQHYMKAVSHIEQRRLTSLCACLPDDANMVNGCYNNERHGLINQVLHFLSIHIEESRRNQANFIMFSQNSNESGYYNQSSFTQSFTGTPPVQMKSWMPSPVGNMSSQNDSAYCSGSDATPGRESLFFTEKGRSKAWKKLNANAVALMDMWYKQNKHHPYPSESVVKMLARQGDITTIQVRKWMANKRVRTNNTQQQTRHHHRSIKMVRRTNIVNGHLSLHSLPM